MTRVALTVSVGSDKLGFDKHYLNSEVVGEFRDALGIVDMVEFTACVFEVEIESFDLHKVLVLIEMIG